MKGIAYTMKSLCKGVQSIEMFGTYLHVNCLIAISSQSGLDRSTALSMAAILRLSSLREAVAVACLMGWYSTVMLEG